MVDVVAELGKSRTFGTGAGLLPFCGISVVFLDWYASKQTCGNNGEIDSWISNIAWKHYENSMILHFPLVSNNDSYNHNENVQLWSLGKRKCSWVVLVSRGFSIMLINFHNVSQKKKYGWREKFKANIEIKMYYSTLKSGFTLFLLVFNIPFFTDI